MLVHCYQVKELVLVSPKKLFVKIATNYLSTALTPNSFQIDR